MLIVLEGMDGAGKTLQAKLLYERLLNRGEKVHSFREPGGTDFGNRIRDILLFGKNIGNETELFLFFSARAELARAVKPLLDRGDTVILDRWAYSSYAYQNVELRDWYLLTEMACPYWPDKGIYLDVPVNVCRERMQGRDRIQDRDESYYQKVHARYLQLVHEIDLRLIDGMGEMMVVHHRILELVD